MLTPITDKAVIVTGGSKGIGKGIAQVFAARGAKVMVAARGREAAAATAEEIRAAGGTAEIFLGDVADWGDVQAMVSATVDAFAGSTSSVPMPGSSRRPGWSTWRRKTGTRCWAPT